jgi:hypothetical protein
MVDDGLDGFGVEVVGLGVLVGRGSDDGEVSPGIGILLVERGTEVEGLVLQSVLNLGVFDRRLLALEHLNFLRKDIKADYFVVLRQKNSVRQANIAGPGNIDFHRGPPFSEFISAFKVWISACSVSYSTTLRFKNPTSASIFQPPQRA